MSVLRAVGWLICRQRGEWRGPVKPLVSVSAGMSGPGGWYPLLLFADLRGSKWRAAAHRRRERPLIEIVEFAADGNAVRQPRDLHVGLVEKVGDVVRGALAVDRGIERDDQLVHGR